ncbi:Avirulence (Avh) protein [Phytophthora megakarya]|uniref:RxLR effector protein n=1 Tax=Phytophthora megakarya TaxID=4795 RepID=A0A225UYT7_9STRA|nr:Avirulence (Avh) protein [Phytophthora megakarya]
MLLTRVLVIVAASFVLASEATVTINSNQAKISTMAHTMARGGPSQRLLRSYKPVEDDSDGLNDLENLDESEERGGNTEQLKALARGWGLSFSKISNGSIKLTEEQLQAWQAIINAGVQAKRKVARDAHNAAWRAEHNLGRRV